MPATTPSAVDSEGRHGTNVGDDPNRESLDYRHGGIRFLVTKIIVKQVQWIKEDMVMCSFTSSVESWEEGIPGVIPRTTQKTYVFVDVK